MGKLILGVFIRACTSISKVRFPFKIIVFEPWTGHKMGSFGRWFTGHRFRNPVEFGESREGVQAISKELQSDYSGLPRSRIDAVSQNWGEKVKHKKTFCTLALALFVRTGFAQVNLTPEQLFPPGDTAWTLETIGLNGTLAFKLLVEHSGSTAQNSFYLDTGANGFPGTVGTATDDVVVFTGSDGPGIIRALPVPSGSYLSLFHDITDATGMSLSGPNGILDVNDAYLNSNPVHNYTRVGPDQLIKYYGANPDLAYQFTAFGQTVQLGSGYVAFIFIEEDHFPNYDYNDMIVGILPACQTNQDCNDGLFCNGVERCEFHQAATGGVCVGGAAPVCEDNVACTVNECREAPGGHTCLFKPHDQDCDDGNYCNGEETCDPVKGCIQGKPVNCDDGIPCTVDTCADKGTCVHTPDDGLCNDGAFCNGVEVCHRKKGCQPGTPPECNDGSECTDDSCDPATNACKFEDDSSCDDGNFCNGIERCDPVNGGCLAGTPPNCNDGISCTTDSCDPQAGACVNAPNNQFCQNEFYCDGVETCVPGQGCQPGTPIQCADSISCTHDACDETTDQCVYTPDSGLCNDSQHCNGVETCDPSVGCVPGVAPNCDDSVSCTVDACDETTDLCTHTPDHESCSNDLYCDGVEVCDPVSGCLDGPDPMCDDGIACTVSRCNEDTNACEHVPNHEACSNNLYCDGVEVCDPQQGCLPGTPPICADDVTCTADSCDEATDQCLHVPNSSLCSDSVFCNGVEICDPELGCQDGADPVCNDGVPCTVDVCDAATDACKYTPDDSLCIDQLFCNGVEVCDPVLGCQDGPDPVCDDGVLCTRDVCDTATDACQHVPDDSLCSNGLYCDGMEICDPLSGCLDGPDPDCDDDVECTIDSCDEPNDSCLHVPNPNSCSDELFCNGQETCDPIADCQPAFPPCTGGLVCDETKDLCVDCVSDEECPNGFCDGNYDCILGECVQVEPPNCDDGIPCTVDTCDPKTGACAQTPDDSLCNNGLFCDGTEVCNPESGCQPGTPVICNDNVACTNDVCDENIDQCVYTPNNNFCLDALFCDGTEVCHPTLGCQEGTPPGCGDNSTCTNDTCNETTDVCDHACEPVGITCTDQVFECDDVGEFLPPVVDSPCTPNPVATCTEEIIPGKLPQERTVRRTCSFTNDCGSSNTCTQVVDIQDTTPPDVICPPDEQVECGGDTTPGEPIVSDNCDPDPEVTVDVQTIQGDCTPNTAGISPPPKLIKLNTFTVTDGGAVVATGDTTGNSASCTQRIEVIDTRPPVFVSCPTSVQGCVGQPLLFVPPSCTDTCGECNVTCTRSDGLPITDPVVEGLTVSCVASDECANASAPCVTAVDTEECSQIPTVSTWGLIVLALLLLIGAKLRFGRDGIFAT